jgi:hypothetical protein
MEMGLFAVRRRPTEGAIFTAPNMLTLQGSDRDGLWSVVEASWPDQPELFGWSPDFETMGYPTKAIYHGHSWEEAMGSLRQYVVAGRKPEPREWRDRIFLLRQIPARSGMFGYFEHCRSPEQFLGLSGDHRDLGGNRWLIFQADHPGSVAYYLDMRGRAGTLDEVGEVEGYPVKILGKFRMWEKAAARLVDLAPDAYRL